jgi:hypothetical protein
LWESSSPDGFLAWLLDAYEADVLFVTHTGIAWSRELPDGRLVVNVGAIGRPPNDGQTSVEYAWVECSLERGVEVSIERLSYDHVSLAEEMRACALPEEFVETVLTGWWTTCLEILPSKERARGPY